MRTRIALTPFVPWLFALASCSSPPKPPTVDESQKRPVNSQMAVELQVCKNELQNTRIVATESGRMAESTAATLQQLAARQQAMAALQAQALAPRPNSVFTIRFDFGSTRVSIPALPRMPSNSHAARNSSTASSVSKSTTPMAA